MTLGLAARPTLPSLQAAKVCWQVMSLTADVYNPFTGTGYCPRLEDLPWKGVVEHLKLKDENGQVT